MMSCRVNEKAGRPTREHPVVSLRAHPGLARMRSPRRGIHALSLEDQRWRAARHVVRCRCRRHEYQFQKRQAV